MNREELAKIAEKNGFHNIKESIENLDESITIQIGVLGEFNSGKSTLINSMLGRKVLPSMDKPTTGSITELEPRSGIDKPHYFSRTNGVELRGISALEFSDIAMGQKEGIVVLQVPEGGILREGYRIIDTPGLASLNQTHTDITFGYLPYLDGAIICQDINKGGLTQSVLQFLKNQNVRTIIDNFLFVLTHADQKPAHSVTKIRSQVIQTLKKHVGDYYQDLENRVIVLSALKVLEKDPDFSLKDIQASFDKFFVERKQKLINERAQKKLNAFGLELLSLLQDKRTNTSLDNNDLKEKERKLEEEIEIVTKEKNKEQGRLQNLQRGVEKTLLNLSSQYVGRYQRASDEELPQISLELVTDITRALQGKINVYIDDFTMPPLSHIGTELESMVMGVNRTKEIGTTLATAAMMAALSNGASLAANAAEAGAGGAAQIAGRAAAKEVVKQSGQAAMIEVTKKTALKQTLMVVSNVMDKINPINYIGDYAAQKFKKNYATRMLEDLSYRVADEVSSYLKIHFEDEVFSPLERRLEDLQSSLRKVWKEQELEADKQREVRQALEQDITLVTHALA